MRQRSALVVESCPRALAGMAGTLRRHGYAVETAACGDEASARLADRVPDLLVVNMLLPGRSGFRVAELVIEQSAGRVPVVMVSDHPSPAFRDYALAAGVSVFLARPFAPALLAAVAEELCPPVRPVGGARPVPRAAVAGS